MPRYIATLRPVSSFTVPRNNAKQEPIEYTLVESHSPPVRFEDTLTTCNNHGVVEYAEQLHFAAIDYFDLLPVDVEERSLFLLWVLMGRNDENLENVLERFKSRQDSLLRTVGGRASELILACRRARGEVVE